MKRILITLWLAVWLAAAACAQPADQQLFQEIDGILASLSKITGLKMLKPVQPELIGREQVKRFLEDRIRQEIKPEEIRAEEITLKKFGFVPRDFDLKKTTVDLLTEQAAAFYDYRKKKLYVLDSNSSAMQEVALVHELAHALADQHFNLARYMQRANENDDGALARLAVMEGQATWLMCEYMAERMNMSLKKSPAIAQVMSQQTAASGGQFPVFDKAPLYIRETLLFPYTKGMLFQQAVVEKEDLAAFGSVFRRPPDSTRQILHPDQYFSGEKPASPALPVFADRNSYRVLSEGIIGEMDHLILLKQYVGQTEAESLTPRWRGGQYRILEHKKKPGQIVLEYSSEWEDADTAKEVFRSYPKVLKGKWTLMEAAAEGDRTLSGKGDDGYFELRLNGNTVTSLEGMEDPVKTPPPVR